MEKKSFRRIFTGDIVSICVSILVNILSHNDKTRSLSLYKITALNIFERKPKVFCSNVMTQNSLTIELIQSGFLMHVLDYKRHES